MPKALRLKITSLMLLALALLAGCGYHAVSTRGLLNRVNGVNVTVFANKSYRPGLEGTLARDLIDELALRTGGKVLRGDQAELELAGSVVSYLTYPVSYTAQNTIKEYRTYITVQAILRDQQTKKVLWKGDITEDQSFPVNANLALQQNAEEAAAARICRRISEDIWRKIDDTF